MSAAGWTRWTAATPLPAYSAIAVTSPEKAVVGTATAHFGEREALPTDLGLADSVAAEPFRCFHGRAQHAMRRIGRRPQHRVRGGDNRVVGARKEQLLAIDGMDICFRDGEKSAFPRAPRPLRRQALL